MRRGSGGKRQSALKAELLSCKADQRAGGAPKPIGEPVYVCGILTKRGSSFPFNWKHRYFHLSPDRCLRYYEVAAVNAATATPKGPPLGFQPKGEVTVVGVKSRDSEGLTFELEAGAEMLIRTSSASDHALWLHSLRSLCGLDMVTGRAIHV